MSERRRYILTLTKVPRAERDKFRALAQPETYFEVRPGGVGGRVAYSVEMTAEEAAQARRDAEDPRSNLIAVDENVVAPLPSTVPDGENLEYVGARSLVSEGYDGSGVVVGVTDSGLAQALIDGLFAGRIKAGRSWVHIKFPVDLGPDPSIVDGNGHGTAVSGIAVPPKAQIAVARHANDGGMSSLDTWIAAVYWLLDEVGVHVINASVAYGIGSEGTPQTAVQDVADHAVSKNVLIFVAAGNGGGDNTGPGEHFQTTPAVASGVYAISNYDRRTDRISGSSNWGNHLFAAAPGMAVSVYGLNGSIEYVEDGGTSYATPFATRLAAMLLSNGISSGNIAGYLASRARKTGASPLYEGNGVLSLASLITAVKAEKPPKKNLQGQPIDRQGRPVNEEGNLIEDPSKKGTPPLKDGCARSS